MVSKWKMKQHKKDEHIRPVHENYVEFRDQILKETKEFRKELYKERFFPLEAPAKEEDRPTMWIMGHSHTPAANVRYVGHVINGSTWNFDGYATSQHPNPQRWPFSGQKKIYDAVKASRVPVKQGAHYMWVPLWVEKAINTYRENDGFAGLTLTEFLDRTLGQDDSSSESKV